MKGRSNFQLDQERRRKYPDKFERRPGGGYRSPAERAKDWREENRSAGLWSRDGLVNRGHPAQDADNYYDRARGLYKQLVEREERDVPSSGYPDYMVRGNPGSAKVIPEGEGFVSKQAVMRWRDLTEKMRETLFGLVRTPLWRQYVNTRASDRDIVRWMRDQGVDITEKQWQELIPQLFSARVAAKIADIESKCAPYLFTKAREYTPKIKRVDARNGIWFFGVQGTKPYTVKIKALRKGNLRDISKLDLYITCSCPYWRWQGPEHHALVHGYLYGKPRGTASVPVIRDPDGVHGACKHVLAVLDHLKTLPPVRKNWRKLGFVEGLMWYDRVQRVANRYLSEIY